MGWTWKLISIGVLRLMTGENQAECRYLGYEKMKNDLTIFLPRFKDSGSTAMEAGAIISLASIEGASNSF
jgi:hypothetical protein